MTASITTLNAERFKNSAFFSLTLRKQFGNRMKITDATKLAEYIAIKRAEANGNSVTGAVVEMDGACKATKQLVISPALNEINTYMSEVKDKLVGRFGKANPSRIKEGMFTVALSLVQEFEDDLAAAQRKLDEELVPAFLADWPLAIERARTVPVKDGGLGPLFNRDDYPDESRLKDAFGFEWQWIALAVPEGLPEGLKAAAKEKLENQLADAANEISLALREGFRELINHATEKLSVPPGEKAKVFRDTLIENIHSFIATFNARNVMNDADLAGLVERAKTILTNGEVTADKLRKFANVRDTTRQQFEEIKSKLDEMITEQTGRKFELE